MNLKPNVSPHNERSVNVNVYRILVGGAQCFAQLVGGGQQRRPDEEEGTDP